MSVARRLWMLCGVWAVALGVAMSSARAQEEKPPEGKKPAAAPAPKVEGCRGSFDEKSAKEPPSPWKNARAHHCHQAAVAAEKAGDVEQCIADASAANELESQFGTRILLARCLKANNKYYKSHAVETALAKDAQKARETDVARAAKERANAIKHAMPVLKFLPPDDVTDLAVKVDGRAIAKKDLERGMWLDPGEHVVSAEGKQDGKKMVFEEKIELKPSKPPLTVLLRLTASVPEWASKRQSKCMLEAKTPDAFAACMGESNKARDINVRVGTEVSGYHDSMDVDVISPVLSIGVEHVIDGWGFGASVLADVVTAASPDIVATASPHWRELRMAPQVHGHVRFDPVDVSLAGSLSSEPDYLATTVGAGVAVDFLQKNLTASLLYQFSYEIAGRAETSFDVDSNIIHKHAGTAGLGFVLSKATFGQVAFTYVYENGDASKPYRHVPMFASEVADAIEPGLGIDSVNIARLPVRPLEQLPLARMRFALSGFLAHRFPSSTLRLLERLYRDDWGTHATTTDVVFPVDVVKEFRLWPHVRFHYQDAANFYRLAYKAWRTADGLVIPALRTGDRELGPLYNVTFGGGMHWDIGTGEVVGLNLSGDAIYTRFLEHLFVVDRWGAFGALSVEVLLE